jgi:hypothetical protein
MPRDEQPKQEPDILDNLFGDPAELADDELDLLFTALAPGVDAAANVRAIAEAAAVKHRLQGKLLPDHVQAALEATRQIKTLDNMAPTKLRQIVEAIKAPFTGPVFDPSYAYRNRDGELNNDDQAIVDRLNEELQKDWDDEERES